ncbi:hypothetical protein SDJN02_24338, partial [Cucurbita argyrosperma subsp. argyrosperma]
MFAIKENSFLSHCHDFSFSGILKKKATQQILSTLKLYLWIYLGTRICAMMLLIFNISNDWSRCPSLIHLDLLGCFESDGRRVKEVVAKLQGLREISFVIPWDGYVEAISEGDNSPNFIFPTAKIKGAFSCAMDVWSTLMGFRWI